MTQILQQFHCHYRSQNRTIAITKSVTSEYDCALYSDTNISISFDCSNHAHGNIYSDIQCSHFLLQTMCICEKNYQILSRLVIPLIHLNIIIPHYIQLMLLCFLHCPCFGTMHHCWSYNRLYSSPGLSGEYVTLSIICIKDRKALDVKRRSCAIFTTMCKILYNYDGSALDSLWVFESPTCRILLVPL